MVINISVQYDGGLLPDIILLTQGYYHLFREPFYHFIPSLVALGRGISL